MKARDEGKGEIGGGKPQAVEEARHQRSQAPPTGYSRYDQEKFRGQEG